MDRNNLLRFIGELFTGRDDVVEVDALAGLQICHF